MMRALEEEDPSGTPFHEPAKRRAFRVFLRRGGWGRLWLILHNAQPIGYVILTLSFSFEFHGLDAFVDELYVHPAHRRQGIGNKAMDLVEENCKELGVNALHLEVSRGNAPAIELYAARVLQTTTGS